MKSVQLKSVVWKEGSYYIAQCLDVDISSFGKTKKEAMRMLEEALELYFEDTTIPITSHVSRPSIALVKLHNAQTV